MTTSIYTPAEQAERVTGGWISVKDRLPIESGKVTALVGRYVGSAEFYLEKGCFILDDESCEQCYGDWQEIYERGECSEVTAWQPLPLPPEAG